MLEKKAPVVGIDLGTTYSAIAYVDEHGDPKIIPNEKNDRITPSVVFFESEKNTIIGQNAKDEQLYPERVVSFVKRNMGKKKETVNDEGMPYTFFGQTYSPEEISAMILRQLKQDAERFFGNIEVKDAVITVPAYFDESERKATKDAGTMAGLNVLQIINEPTAAAISYAVKNKEIGNRVFVFDLGGGTFDITILNNKFENGNQIIDIIDTDGDHRLGGKDWDDAIVDFASDEFQSEHGESVSSDIEAISDLKKNAENAKKQLSEKEKAGIVINANGCKTKMEITKDKFEELTSHLLERTRTCCTRLMEKNKLSWSDIDTILLVGGSTRMPPVKMMLREISGKEIRDDLVQPDECVALGAALRGTMIAIATNELNDNAGVSVSNEVKAKLGKIEVRDILSRSLGTIVFNEDTNEEKVAFLLSRGTTLPCIYSDRFVTVSENQKRVRIDAVEGESMNVEKCKLLVGKDLIFNRPMPKGSPIEITFMMDDSNLLSIRAKDLTDNIEIDFKIERDNNLSDKEIEEGKNNIQRIKISGK